MLTELLKKHRQVDVLKMRAKDFLLVQNQIEEAKINWIVQGSGWKEIAFCPVCGSAEKKKEFSKYSVDIACCLNCFTRYCTQIPANLNDVYRNPGYLSYSKEDSDEHYNYRRERFGRERVEIIERYCGNLTEKHLLDVGCGNGYFLSVAMEKCKYCYGTEFSEKLREFTRLKTGLTVFSESLDKLPKKDFDIVTLFDVIEHIPEPISFMISIDRILQPGGYVLIFTPNFDSFGIRVMQNYSSIIDPTEHVVVYTLPSLNFLAKKLGYEVVYAETKGLDILNIISMQQYKNEEPDLFLTKWNNELQAMIDTALCGDYARIMFKKP